MSRREHNKLSSQPSTGFVHLMTITRPGTTVFDNIPSEFTTLGLWIVGGGGSGASEHYNSGNSGCGGNGGQARSFEINYTGGILIVDVGSGGPATATGTNKTGANGGDSSVTYNGATYTAKGGLMAPGGNTTGTPSKVDFSGRGGVGWGWNWPGTGYPDPSIVGRYPDGFVGNGETDFPTRLTPMIQIYTEQAVAVVFAHIEMVTHILTTHFLMVERMVEGVVVEAAIIMPLIEVAMPLFMVPVVAAAHSHQIMDTVPVARVIKA